MAPFTQEQLVLGELASDAVRYRVKLYGVRAGSAHFSSSATRYQLRTESSAMPGNFAGAGKLHDDGFRFAQRTGAVLDLPYGTLKFAAREPGRPFGRIETPEHRGGPVVDLSEHLFRPTVC
jgi:hypothetical protein